MIWEGSHPHPRIEDGAGSVCTGTTVGFPGFPRRAGEGGFQTRPYGSRSRGGVTLTPVSSTGQAPPSTVEGAGTPHQVPIRRGQRADTWVRPYGAGRGGESPSPRIEYGAGFALSRRGRGGRGDPAPGPRSSGTAGGHVGPPLRSAVGGAPSPPYRVRGRLPAVLRWRLTLA